MTSAIPLRWSSHCGRYRIAIRKRCVRQMLEMARRQQPEEIGSSLYGGYSTDGARAIVHGPTPVPSDSRSSRSTFLRGVDGLCDFFRNLFQQSGGRRHYVGEWHSHPNGPTSASSLDWSRQRELSGDTAMHCPESILLIVGGDLREYPQLAVFVYSRRNGPITLEPASPRRLRHRR